MTHTITLRPAEAADLPQLALDATANDTLRLSRIRPLDAKAVEAIFRRAMG